MSFTWSEDGESRKHARRSRVSLEWLFKVGFAYGPSNLKPSRGPYCQRLTQMHKNLLNSI